MIRLREHQVDQKAAFVRTSTHPMGQGKVRGPLEAALAGGERLYGQQMDPFGLAIVDEAHSTAGELGRPWAAIHDNARIPASFRLYLTATPRILAAARPQKGTGGQEAEIASMSDDPDGLFGAWLPGAELGLSEAIEREILAGFEIDVLEIRDPSPVLGESEEARRGHRLAQLQTALLEHAAAYNLRTVMTFHQKVEEARAFADKLPETAADLYMNDASNEDLAAADRQPKSSIDAEFYELEAGRHVPRTGSGRRGCAATTLSVSGARSCASSPTASTPPDAGSTAPSSPAAASSAKASTSPASGASRPSASPTPAAHRSRSCRTSAGR